MYWGGTIHEVGQERGGRKECGLAQARVLVGRRGVDGTNVSLLLFWRVKYSNASRLYQIGTRILQVLVTGVTSHFLKTCFINYLLMKASCNLNRGFGRVIDLFIC